MSIQIAILKILASHGDGTATVASINRDIELLTRSGREWSDRMRRLSSRAAGIDIFGSGHVVREPAGWRITQSGRDFLILLEVVPQDNRPPSHVTVSADPKPAAGRAERPVPAVRIEYDAGRRRDLQSSAS